MVTSDKLPIVSFFNAGYINEKKGVAVLQCNPCKEVSIIDIYNYVRGDEARKATKALRAETDEKKQKTMKTLSFCYCTPFGTFSYRNAEGLKEPSGMMVVDIDDLKDEEHVKTLREALLQDKRFETELLFISPRGRGLKWFIQVGDMGGRTLKEFFPIVARHIAFCYGIDIDPSGKDTPRPCYLSHDPECYINPKYTL